MREQSVRAREDGWMGWDKVDDLTWSFLPCVSLALMSFFVLVVAVGVCVCVCVCVCFFFSISEQRKIGQRRCLLLSSLHLLSSCWGEKEKRGLSAFEQHPL